MNVNLPWKMTLLALSISGIVACGGGGGGGGGAPVNNTNNDTQSRTITKENADEIASLTASGSTVGKSSENPKRADDSSSRSRNASLAGTRSHEEDENEDFEDDDSEDDDSEDDDYEDLDPEALKEWYSDLIGENIQEESACEISGTSSYNITFVQPQESEIYRFEGTIAFDKCQDDKADYRYDGDLKLDYSQGIEQLTIKIEGDYTQQHKSGVKIETTHYKENATETDSTYTTSYSYDATGTPFGDKKVHVTTPTPIVTDESSENPSAGSIRVESEDGSFLTMTVTPDGNGVNISVNGDQEEFKSWSELEGTDLSMFGGADDEDEEDDEETDDDSSDNTDEDDSSDDDSVDEGDSPDEDDEGDEGDESDEGDEGDEDFEDEGE